jgi:hypothetical protein
MVLMLRSLDIPTREVTGFIGGEFDAATNSWVVRGSAAHAWPQVYFKGVGWVDFEPTPNQDNIQRPADPSAVPPEPVSTPPPPAVTPSANNDLSEQADPRNKPVLKPDEGNTAANSAAAQDKSLPVWLIVSLLMALAGTGLYFSRKLYLKRLYALPDLSPLAIYNRMSQSARKAGLRGRSGMTPYEYANYLSRQIPEAAKSVDAITRAYVRRRYGPESPELEDIKHQQHVEALRAAEQQLRTAEATGHDARQEELWQLFKAHTDIYNDDRSARVVWENYQEAVLAYRRQKRLDKVTPEFVRLLQQRFKRLNPNQG